ncbi:hypothetical protein GGI06_002641 [Coemansia sp. S85]|nr:hypothetical protein GGI06_002641 [Coemansia sp. S85]
MSLVKGLPALAMISCGIYGLDSEFEFIPADELPDHIASAYNGAGKRLHTWRLESYHLPELNKLAEYIILLALACPKLRMLMVDPMDSPMFNATITETLQSSLYSKYAAQLSHLHNIAYNNGYSYEYQARVTSD